MGSLEREMRRRATRSSVTLDESVASGGQLVPSAAIEEVSAANSGTGHDELYLVVGGERIAYRGHPGTPQARTWVPIKPGVVFENHDGDEPSETEVRAMLGLPDDVPIIDGGDVQWFPEPKGSVQ